MPPFLFFLSLFFVIINLFFIGVQFANSQNKPSILLQNSVLEILIWPWHARLNWARETQRLADADHDSGMEREVGEVTMEEEAYHLSSHLVAFILGAFYSFLWSTVKWGVPKNWFILAVSRREWGNGGAIPFEHATCNSCVSGYGEPSLFNLYPHLRTKKGSSKVPPSQSVMKCRI